MPLSERTGDGQGLRLTLRQVLGVLWTRKWIIVAVTIAAVLTSAAYLLVRTETFDTHGSIRLNTVVTDAVSTSSIGGVRVDLGVDVVDSPAVLDPAAASLGETTDVLSENIKAEVIEEERTAQMRIVAVGSTPQQAQERAEAVVAAYRAYVDEQLLQTTAALEERRTAAIADATGFQQAIAKNPADSIAATNLTEALSRMSSASSQLDDINNAGPATTVLSPVPLGASTVPSELIVLALALLTGLIVGMSAALIRDQFDDRLRGEDEIEGLTGVPGLGELSWDRSVARLRPPLPVAENERTDLSEGFRTLRSTLQVLLPPREGVIVVTSVEPGDGKSFVSANLALAWARAGRRVILVGGDLRRPDLGRYFGDSADGEGLAEILEEDESADSVGDVESRINSTRYRRLRVLPAGAEPVDPADLLARSSVTDVIATLRGLADIVIIDSPPAMGMSDAASLASHADGAVVIATVRRTNRNRILDTVAALRAADVQVFGVVANRSRRKLPKSYSAYYLQSRKGRPFGRGTAPDRERAGSAKDSEQLSDILDDLEDEITETRKLPQSPRERS